MCHFIFLLANSLLFGENNLLQDMWGNWWLRLYVTAPVENTPMPHSEPDEVPDNPLPLCAHFDHPEKDNAINAHITRFRWKWNLYASILFWISSADLVDMLGEWPSLPFQAIPNTIRLYPIYLMRLWYIDVYLVFVFLYTL